MRKIWIGLIVVMLACEAGLAASNIRLTEPIKDRVVGVTPVFKWRKLAGAESYTLEISTDADFNGIVLTVKTEEEEWGYPAQWAEADPSKLSVKNTYYWRVTADTGDQSDHWLFAVGYVLDVTVKDDEGNVINGASVTLTSEDGKLTSTSSTTNGEAVVYGFGNCDLSIKKPWYA
jgi:hypothetical protein